MTKIEERVNAMNDRQLYMLRYLEEIASVHQGRWSAEEMNQRELDVIYNWEKEGLIRTGMIIQVDVTDGGDRWLTMREDMIDMAHLVRKQRVEEGWKSRTYNTVFEMEGGIHEY